MRAEPALRSPVSFRSGSLSLAGDLYRPSGVERERAPAVALCEPIGSVKEQTLPRCAERLADTGYTALT